MASAKPIKNRPLPDEKIGGDDAELLRIARERYQKAIDQDQENRIAAIDDLRFLAGEQWPDEIRRERQEDRRPVLTINRMPQFVRQVTGDIRLNSPSIKVRPADDVADDEIADVFTGTIRHIEYASDAQVAYQTAAEGAAQCGIGHFRIVTEYSTDDTFEQDIRIRRIQDHFAVTWDPHAVEPTRWDARYCFVEESLDIETFKARYPKASTSGWDFQDRDNSSYIGDWLTHETVRVAEYWTIEKELRELVLLSDGRVIDATEIADSDDIYLDPDSGEQFGAVRRRKVWRNKVRMRIINGVEVLEGPFEWPGMYIPVVPVLGEEVHIQRTTIRFGVIRHAKDPQRLYNYWRSAQTEKIALEPKAPFLVTPGNVKGLEKFWKDANTRNMPYLPYLPDKENDGAVPKRNAPQMGSAAIAQELLVAADDMKATTGIYDASLGARGNETSGVAIRARQQESDISTIAYVDNLARAIRHAGRILIDLIPKIYDSERVIRVMNEDDSTDTVTINQTVTGGDGKPQRVNDLSLGKYDVVVSTGPSFNTKRQESAQTMIDLVQAMPQVGAVIIDILVRSLDMPDGDEIAERLKKTLPPGLVESDEEPTPEEVQAQQQAEREKQQQQQLAQMAVELDLAGKQLELAKTEAEIAKAGASAGKMQAETEGQSLENAQTALELAVANGAMQDMVARQVGTLLTQMFGPPPVNPGVQQ